MDVLVNAYKENSRRERRDELILSHLDFVRHIIGKQIAQLPPSVDAENLEAAAIFGLVEAAEKFDESRGTEFKTFAYSRVRGAIFDELRRNCILPQKVLQRIAAVKRICESIQGSVTPEAIAEVSDLSVHEVEEVLDAIRLTQAEPWDESFINIERQHSNTPEAAALRQETMVVLTECIMDMDGRDQQLLDLYYRLDLRLKEIGNVLDLSESRVSRLLSAAQIKLGKLMRSRGVNMG